MKKKYLKPDAEYVDLISAEKITGDIFEGDWDTSDMPDDWNNR